MLQKITALRQAAHSSPEYADIVPLFIALYEYLHGREHLTGIEIVNSGANQQNNLENRIPLICSTDLKINRERTVEFLGGLIAVLTLNGKENVGYLETILLALQQDALKPATLYGAILERNRAPINTIAELLVVPAPLVEYIFEIPLKTALEHFSRGHGAEEVSGWEENFCPICGSRASMAELSGEEGKRMLSCSACSFTWPFQRLACAYCGCTDPEKLSYFTVGDGATRVDTCAACSRYIKTRDSRKCDSDVPLEVEDLLTIHLDLMATREGFERGK
jgi:FdhE protein